eukprot:7046752-Pyramimonas_sp.AAC.1
MAGVARARATHDGLARQLRGRPGQPSTLEAREMEGRVRSHDRRRGGVRARIVYACIGAGHYL